MIPRYGFIVVALLLGGSACGSSAQGSETTESGSLGTTRTPLSSSRHQQATRAGVEHWANAETTDRLVLVSLIGDTDPVASARSETHFDNCYWEESRDWILAQRKSALDAAIQWYETNDTDRLDTFYASFGFALHATQDFYAHSNWVETHDPGILGTFVEAASPRPAGWMSGTYDNPGDTGPYAGADHCPQGTPTHAQLNKDGAGGAAANEALVAAVRATTDQLKRLVAELQSAMPADTSEALFARLGIRIPTSRALQLP